MIVCCSRRCDLGRVLSTMIDQPIIVTECIKGRNIHNLFRNIEAHPDQRLILCLCLQSGNPKDLLRRICVRFSEKHIFIIIQSNKHTLIDERVNRSIINYALANKIQTLSISTNQGKGKRSRQQTKVRDRLNAAFLSLSI